MLSPTYCFNADSYTHLHITNVSMAPSQSATVALEQHGPNCDWTVRTDTWGGVDLRRYMQFGGEVWIPLSHFRINLQRVSALSFRALLDSSPISMGKIEFAMAIIPEGIPEMAAQSPVHYHCVDPTMLALTFDEGR